MLLLCTSWYLYYHVFGVPQICVGFGVPEMCSSHSLPCHCYASGLPDNWIVLVYLIIVMPLVSLVFCCKNGLPIFDFQHSLPCCYTSMFYLFFCLYHAAISITAPFSGCLCIMLMYTYYLLLPAVLLVFFSNPQAVSAKDT